MIKNDNNNESYCGDRETYRTDVHVRTTAAGRGVASRGETVINSPTP